MAENLIPDVVAQDEEFAARITATGDHEGDHSHADQVLLEALRLAGFVRLADAWDKHSADWWWA